MRKRLRALLVAAGSLQMVVAAGCSMSELKNDNRRLKEANDHLVSENNRLGQQLAENERQMMDKNRDLAQMQDQFDKASGAKGASGGVEDFKGSGVESERTREGVILRLDDAVFFSTGKAALSREGQRILTRVAGIINRKYPRNVIRVEGHTDDVPVKKVKNAYPTNWELSTARACSVVRHLVSSGGVNPHRVYPAGFSYYRPRVNGTNPGSRSKNRRVEILILDQKR